MKSSVRCRLCRRLLSYPESLARGIGPECATKYQWMLSDAGLTLEALEIPESISTDPLVARSLYLAERALLAGRRDHMERFKIAAKEAAGAPMSALTAAGEGERQ